MTAMIEKAKKLTAQELMAEVRKMMACTEDYADTVISALLSALETKITKTEFVAFCESI